MLDIINKKFFKGKVVLVSGGNGQLGKDISKMYKKLGCIVYSLDLKIINRTNNKGINQIKLDISQIEQCKKIIKYIYKKEKKIDILINNAGASIFSHFRKRSVDQLDLVYNVNLKGTINMIIALDSFIKKNNKNKVDIINIGSIYGSSVPDFNMYKKGDRFNSEIYGATKAGIIQITRYFAKILSDKHIFCNCISPGGIKSNNKQSSPFQKRYIKNLIVKRMANTSDILFGIYYLSHPKNNYITGQNLIIDGGLSLKWNFLRTLF